MKTMILLLVLTALAGVAAWTKPSQASFKNVILGQLEGSGASLEDRTAREVTAEVYMTRVRYVDHVLWVSMERGRDGTVLYIGVLGHWFSRLKENQSLAGMLDDAPLESMLRHMVGS